MNDEQNAPTPALGPQSDTRAERRRHRRVETCIPITVTCSNDALVEGYAENVSLGGLLAQSIGGMPVLGEACRLTIYLEGGPLLAQGHVLRINLRRRTFVILLHHFESNGPLLLARQLGLDP